MRVLVAPDKFAGTLTAVEAAEAIAAGWSHASPADEIDLAPLSDGGPGFVDVIHTALGGDVLSTAVTGPLGDTVPATVLLRAGTAYIEVAQACGLHLVPEDRRDPGRTGTYGVGELLAAAADAGAGTVLVGLGGSATNDGGAGMLAALGAMPAGVLSGGGLGLAALSAAEIDPARARLDRIELVAASDVDNALLGPRGASAVFGPQKGASREDVLALDAALTKWAELTDRTLADEPGAGAAGGLGFGLLLLGARRVPGIRTVLTAVGLADRAAAADVVVTGEGSYDVQSLHGKVVSGVANLAGRHARPCVVLAGQVRIGRREAAGAGVSAAYAVAESAGSAEAAMARPAEHLAGLAERVARTWSPRRP